MKPANFEYHAPGTCEGAVSLLAELGEDARVLAGGQSLIPMLAMRLAVFPHLIDIGGAPELRGIERRDGNLVVGATTPQAAVEADTSVASAVPLLSKATPLIGHFQIRNRGTVGGSLAHADPAAEYPAVALALDAQMRTESTRGPRVLAARDFFAGLWSTAMEPDELLVQVLFPVWSGRRGFAIEEFARRHGDFAIAGAVVAVQLAPSDERVERCAVSLFGLGPTPLRADTAERQLTGSLAFEHSPDEIGRIAMSEVTEAPDDLHGSASYRLRVGAAMVSRAWAVALEEARHG